MDRSALENIFVNYGFPDFKWISSKDVITAQWVRFKCMFGCDSYGKKGSCPPHVPSVAECREFISDYRSVVIFRIEQRLDNPEGRSDWSREVNFDLLKVERDVFLSGHRKAFLLFMDDCQICTVCSGSRENCIDPRNSRPGPESLAIDVFETVRKSGFPIEVLKDYGDTMNRYAFLFVE